MVVFWLLVIAAGSATAPEPLVSIPEYVAQLDALTAALAADSGTSSRAATLVEALPRTIRVDAATRIFDIPTESIQHEFRAWQIRHDAAALRRLQSSLHTLRSEAARFEEPAAAATAQRALLTGILNATEFRNVHGPTWIDRLRQRAFELLVSLLVRLFQPSAIPTICSILAWLMAVAVVVLALAALDSSAERRGNRSSGADAPRLAVWLEARGRGRAEAGATRFISCWCGGVPRSQRRVAADRARTPRVLRLLPSSSDDGATLATLHAPRAGLVRQRERRRRGVPDSIANLKKMGPRRDAGDRKLCWGRLASLLLVALTVAGPAGGNTPRSDDVLGRTGGAKAVSWRAAHCGRAEQSLRICPLTRAWR
jgi:hypothetical protein